MAKLRREVHGVHKPEGRQPLGPIFNQATTNKENVIFRFDAVKVVVSELDDADREHLLAEHEELIAALRRQAYTGLVSASTGEPRGGERARRLDPPSPKTAWSDGKRPPRPIDSHHRDRRAVGHTLPTTKGAAAGRDHDLQPPPLPQRAARGQEA